jgi:hypothetical protein
MKRYAPCAALAALALLSACGSNNTPPLTGAFRAANGITDNTDGMDAALGNVAAFSGIGFDTASGLTDVPEGSYNAQITASSNQFNVDNVSIDHNNVSTVFTYGTLAGKTEGGFVAEESLDQPTNNQIEIQPLHDAYAVSQTSTTLYFYFVTPGAGVSGTPVTADFASNTTSVPLDPGTYEILVTDGTTTVFDSGPKGIALPFSNGSNVFQLAALDATTATSDGSTISLLLLDNNGHYTPLLNGQN